MIAAMKRRLSAGGLAAVLVLGTLGSRTLDAQSFVPATDIVVPGGTAGVAEAMGMPPPDLAVFIPELVRRIYAVPQGRNARVDRLQDVFRSYLDAVDQFDQALSGVQTRGGAVSLTLAAKKGGREHLKDVLDGLGLTLREHSQKYSVEAGGDKPAVLSPLFHRLGVDPVQIARRLNEGDSIRIEVTSDVVPLPLDAATWSHVILQEKVPPSRLFARVMSERRAALLAHGLAWLDDETLLYLAHNPDLLRKLYEDHAPVFAGFGRSVRVRENRIAVPGGSAAEPLWETVVDEKVDRPDRFIRSLLEKQDGRLAYFYDAIASLDAPHARFALGLWIPDSTLRAERFRALTATSRDGLVALQPKTFPFVRLPLDLAIVLARIRVQPDGVPAAPSTRALWDMVFASADIPDDPAKELKNLRPDGVMDAAWLADKTMTVVRTTERAERLDTIAFGQRVMGGAPDAALPDVLMALRGFMQFRMLMLTLDRMGVADPALFAAAARRARSIGAFGPDRAFFVLAQFQPSLALVARMHAARSLDGPRAHQLVRDLVAIEPAHEGYRGAVARWLDQSLLAALPAATDVSDEMRLLQALAGRHEHPGPARTIEFEDRTYRVDLPGAELRRLTEVRRRQGGHDLSDVLAFARAVRHLALLNPTTATVADVRGAAEMLQRTGAVFKPDKIAPPGVERTRDPRAVLAKTLKDLGRIAKPQDVQKAPEAAGPLYELSDALLARTLMACTYALAIGDAGGTVLLAADPSRRHDFGLLDADEERRRRTPWLLPAEQLDAGVPWHVLGSALALDVGLSRLALRRVSGDKAVEHPEAVNATDQRTFMRSLALLDPTALVDAERDEIAAAIARGRARVAAADAAALETIAREIHPLAVDGLRRRALRWTLANAPAHLGQWLSMAELAALGTPSAPLHPWGMSGLVVGACLCTTLHTDMPWHILAGQTSLGMLPANVADLNLRVLEISAGMKIPAALGKPILAAALQAFLDEANPSDGDDWMTLVRTAQRLTREDIEDYMAALTANGTLVPTGAITAAITAGRR